MILFENVTKKYRGTAKPALDGIDLQVDRGEFVFIVGASGSGKSSCLRLILREDQPSAGKIHVLGQDLSKISSRKVPYFRRNLGTVFQDFRLLTNKTVYDNVAFSLQVIGKSRGFIQEAVPDTLELVGLANKAKRFPHELSGGEQQRVAIARAIVNKPAILLADEPTGNLDPATSLGIMQLLRAINAAGTTVVMATHEATFVDIMQQRVVELSQGVVVRDEQAGGYGETASIPVADLSAEGVRVLRTTEAVVRAALAPEEIARANAAAAAGAAAVEDGAGGAGAAAAAAASAEARAVSAAAAAAAGAASAVAASAAPPVPETPEASVYQEPQPFGEHDDEIDGDLDDTVRADGGPQAKRIPGFLDPGRPIDPVHMSETGNLAAHLGLDRNDDDETDVGPVR
ncbi:cell division ATP-binding protein FtsE [Leucobacter luti]|uniref:Cell division ATP-binding protein FtsE n=1 Tax=Leucobacter luti TaxID=340320 RepID=A0A4Q7TZ39_9MICO|nr:cell division ATP-binding protein FtsE [Leucobacter luti]MBL3698533.1 cell division ATP-binding protein FtsE [Leucobacter luti]RZT65907.1 cell division transport system ATP-binding protein [Leucobacter luti]